MGLRKRLYLEGVYRPTGHAQELIYSFLEKNKGKWFSSTNLWVKHARELGAPERGWSHGKVMSAMKALAKKGLVKKKENISSLEVSYQ